MMNDCYYPPSGNFLAPTVIPERAQLAPESILENLTQCARVSLDGILRGVIVYRDVVRVHGEFLINRRWVRVGMAFTVIGGKLVEAPRTDALAAISRQLNTLNN